MDNYYGGSSFYANLPCGLCTLFTSGTLYRSESCSAFFSKTRGIRVVTYTEIAFRDVHYQDTFFLTTKNDGKDWQQKIYIPDGAWETELCRNVTTLDGTLVWTWSFGTIYRSEDSGDTWQIQRVPLGWEWEEGDTKQISFEDYQNGYLIFEVYGGDPITFLTSDGGETWHRAEEEIQEESGE
jgi:photosystem II stability/assembly factor-like uncharacterized protein